MLKKGSILFILFLPFQLIWAQEANVVFHSDFEKKSFQQETLNPFQLLIASDSNVNIDKYTQFQTQLESSIIALRKIRSKTKNDLIFLEKAFYRIHRKQLGWYENYVSLSQTFESKKYDCLTGTALFALILEDFEFQYQILEFDFHIFLIAQVDGENVLIEATDPLNGFVKDQKEIEKRVDKAFLSSEVSGDFLHTFTENKINLLSLAGLQYFNLAVDLFNRGEYKKAHQFIQKANLLYSSERIQHTKELISSTSL